MTKLQADGYHQFRSTKNYGHDLGLSCCFRQPGATSHCRWLHGYALRVKLEFSSEELNETNWVADFGGLKNVKSTLQERFDHKCLVASDDPLISTFRELAIAGAIDLRIVSAVGIEAFAYEIFQLVRGIIHDEMGDRVRLERVEVWEHEGNSASYGRGPIRQSDLVKIIDNRIEDAAHKGIGQVFG